jgi:outer membrane protein assembly factor BamB
MRMIHGIFAFLITGVMALALLCAVEIGTVSAVEPWATYRGNMQRTGNTDNIGGPAVPKVLWVLKSTDHHVASPVPIGDKLLISGLGPFNIGVFSCLGTSPGAKERVLWSKTVPTFRLPTVSSPGLVGGKVIFGDGMHQTDGGAVYCVDLAKGSLVWQLPVAGNLVHFEGAPTVADDKAYIGGGAAGVLCIDINKVTLDGKPMDLAGVERIREKRWKELLAKYEIDKRNDPCFPVPPSEDQLPRASPNRIWQQGKDKWHVDASVAVANGKVLAASAFLDKEQVGDRALYCLDARTGNVLWRKPLKLNPWGGPSVSQNTVIVSGGSIAYDPSALKEAKGFIAAFDLNDGSAKWFKDIGGAVLGSAALANGAAVVTATDGKVRAFGLADGKLRWTCNTGQPLFAPVAISRNSVYAGDLDGVLHAIDLKSGKKRWTLDLATHPDVQSPGMIYGGPVVHGGRVYLANCNLVRAHGGARNVVVCIGEK